MVVHLDVKHGQNYEDLGLFARFSKGNKKKCQHREVQDVLCKVYLGITRYFHGLFYLPGRFLLLFWRSDTWTDNVDV